MLGDQQKAAQRIREGEIEIQRDRAHGIIDPVLEAERRIAARTNDFSRVSRRIRENGYDLNVRSQTEKLIRLSAEQQLPFWMPKTDIGPKHGCRMFTINLNGNGLWWDLLQVLPRGIAVVGAPGTGKTSLMGFLAQCVLALLGVGFYFFGVREECTDALPGYTVVSQSEILPNIVEIFPGVDPGKQVQDAARIFGDADYQQYSTTALQRVILDLHDKGICPTVRRVRNEVWARRPSALGVDSRQKQKLGSMLDNYILDVGEQAARLERGFDIARHAQEKVIVRGDLSTKTYATCATSLINRAYLDNVSHGRRESLEIVFAIDEARWFLPANRQRQASAFGEPFLYELLTLLRSAGIGQICGTQTEHPSTYLGVTSAKVLLNNGHAPFFESMGRAMGLNREQLEFGLKALGVGQAIVKCPYSPEPLLATMSLPVLGTEPEQQRRERRERFLAEVAAYRRYQQDNPAQLTLAKAASQESQEKSKESTSDNGLLRDAERLLLLYGEEPLQSSTEARAQLGVSVETARKMSEHLVDNGFAKQHEIRIFKSRGRTPIVHEVTKKGFAYLREAYGRKLRAVELPGKGGYEHKINAYLIAISAKKNGDEVTVEWKDADLAIRNKEGELEAVEVANGDSKNLAERIEQNELNGAIRTRVVCSDIRTIRRALRQFANDQRVVIEHIEKYRLDPQLELPMTEERP